MSPTVKKISWEVRIAGRVVPRVTEVSCSAGFEQINSEATVTTTARPSWVEEGAAVTIWATRGALSGQIFGGEVSAIDWSYAPRQIQIVCRDLLARTRLEWGGEEYEYADQDDAAIIRNLLEKMGIPSSAASIESSSWTLGTIEPIVLKSGVAPSSIVQEIDDLAGYRTYSLTTGVIVRRRVSGIPGETGALSFERGVNILTGARRSRTRDGIVNRCIVTGVEYEGLTIGGPGVGEASAPNPYIPDPPGFVTESIQSNLVEDDAKALEIATRRVSDKNRRPEGLDLTVLFDPRAQPGMTVLVEHDSLETGSATTFVSYVGHTLSTAGATTTLRTTGGNLSGFALQDPIASFDVQLFKEGEDTGSGVTAILVGVADGSASYDPDGTIASYAWTIAASGGTPDPMGGTGPIQRFTVDGPTTEVTITLTVTDADGATGTLARAIPITASTILVEDLYLAYGDVACSSDGEQTWRAATPASGSATCLAAFAPAWGQVWGTDTGHIYATFDRLLTALIDLGAPHGSHACTALWVHEVDDTRLWAGFDDGTVYQGTLDLVGQTATWALAGAIPDAPVAEIRESYGALGELRATSGAGYYYSPDAGHTWALQHTFDVAARMAAGFDQNIATGLNSTPPIYGESVTPTVPGGVTHLRGVTFGWRTQALYATDDAAALYTTDDTFAALTAHADTLDAQGNHLVRSGNIDGPVIYAAIGDGTGANNGFQKWLPGTRSPFYIRKTGSAAGLMIGYGPSHPPILTGRVEILLVGGEGTVEYGIHHYVPGVGWTRHSVGLPDREWRGCAVDPFNTDRWLAWSNDGVAEAGGVLVCTGDSESPIFVTEDNGATFTAVPIAAPSGLSWANLTTRPEWSQTTPGEILMVGGGDFFSIYRGTISGMTGTQLIAGTMGQEIDGVTTGFFDDVIVLANWQVGALERTAYITPDNALHLVGSDLSDTFFVGLDRLSPSGAIVAATDTEVWGSSDYRTVALTARTTASATDITATATRAYLSTLSGVVAIDDPLGTPAASVVAASGLPINAIRADRQQRIAVGALRLPGPAFLAEIEVFDGTSWSTITGPAALPSNYFVDTIEIIVREVAS